MAKTQQETFSEQVPRCIGIIPDGNRRWAKDQGLSTSEGHKKGSEKLREVLEWSKEAGVKNVVVYTFSIDNWRRSEEEIASLKGIMSELLDEFENQEARKEKESSVSIHFLGHPADFGEELSERAEKLEEHTAGREHHLYLALSYGGRGQILEAVKRLARDRSSEEMQEINEDDLRAVMQSVEMPDPDLIIRTSGEKRLSNFLPWESIYSELAFVDTHWPAFSREEFHDVLEDYTKRQRRHGK